jgi:hypothetical protein
MVLRTGWSTRRFPTYGMRLRERCVKFHCMFNAGMCRSLADPTGMAICRSPGDVVYDCGIQPWRGVTHSTVPALDAAAAPPGLMPPVAAGLFFPAPDSTQ